MTPTLFSVIIPLYNKEETIERAIQSVLNQLYPHFELLVVDDGSTDGSAEIVKNQTDSRIRLIQQKNQGVSAARNTGITNAKSEYVAFLDADDEWLPNFLEEMNRLIQRYPNCGWYSCGLQYVTKSRKKPQFTQHKEGVYSNYFEIGLDSVLAHPSSIVIPKTVALKVGGFPVGVSRQEDALMWIKIASLYPFAHTPNVCSVYYFQEKNVVKRMENKEPDIYFEHLELGNETKNEFLATHAIHRGIMESIYGDKETAKLVEKNYAFTKSAKEELKKLKRFNRIPSVALRSFYFLLTVLVQTKRKIFHQR